LDEEVVVVDAHSVDAFKRKQTRVHKFPRQNFWVGQICGRRPTCLRPTFYKRSGL